MRRARSFAQHFLRVTTAVVLSALLLVWPKSVAQSSPQPQAAQHPDKLHSDIAANEASAVGSLRAINTAQVTYAAAFPDKGFARTLAALGPDTAKGETAPPSAEHAALLNETLGCKDSTGCIKSGYRVRITAVCKTSFCDDYVSVAVPIDETQGTRSFCSTSEAIIRTKPGLDTIKSVAPSACRTWRPLN